MRHHGPHASQTLTSSFSLASAPFAGDANIQEFDSSREEVDEMFFVVRQTRIEIEPRLPDR